MAKLTLDGTTVQLDSTFEQILRHTLNGNKSFKVEGGSFPEIPSFASDTFTTMTLTTDDNKTIPVVNTYNKIQDFTTNYREEDKIYSYSITLAYEE